MIWIFFLGLIVIMVVKPKTMYFLVPLGVVILFLSGG